MIIAETRMCEMPESCSVCDLFRNSTMECSAKRLWFGMEDLRMLTSDRPNWCPLIEVEKKSVRVEEET